MDELEKDAFIFATGKLMRAMYWLSGIVDGMEGHFKDPGLWYPGWLAEDLFIIANQTKRLERKIKVLETGGHTGSGHPGLHTEEGDEIVDSLTDDQLDQINDTLSNDEGSGGGELEEFFVEQGIPREAAVHIIDKYRSKFLEDPVYQLRKKNANRLSLPAQSYYQNAMAAYNATKNKAAQQRYRNTVQATTNMIKQNDFDGDEEKQDMADRKAGYTKFLTDTKPNKTPKKAKGGKVKFEDKVEAIEKTLVNKPVEKQYQQQYGKHYTRKMAHEAAQQIIGAQTKKEKIK
jgi:hypothetical protein